MREIIKNIGLLVSCLVLSNICVYAKSVINPWDKCKVTFNSEGGNLENVMTKIWISAKQSNPLLANYLAEYEMNFQDCDGIIIPAIEYKNAKLGSVITDLSRKYKFLFIIKGTNLTIRGGAPKAILHHEFYDKGEAEGVEAIISKLTSFGVDKSLYQIEFPVGDLFIVLSNSSNHLRIRKILENHADGK